MRDSRWEEASEQRLLWDAGVQGYTHLDGTADAEAAGPGGEQGVLLGGRLDHLGALLGYHLLASCRLPRLHTANPRDVGEAHTRGKEESETGQKAGVAERHAVTQAIGGRLENMK